jgi:hypothetical protein
MTPTKTTPSVREPSFVDVAVLDFGPLYEQAVAHYVSLDPKRQTWPKEKLQRLVVRTECRWGRIALDEQNVFLVSEKGVMRTDKGSLSPRQPLSDKVKGYVALFAELKPGNGEAGFFEEVPFCKVPIDRDTVMRLRSIGVVALEDFIRTKIPEMEAAYNEWRSVLLETKNRILAGRHRHRAAVRPPAPKAELPTEIPVETPEEQTREGESEGGPRVRA